MPARTLLMRQSSNEQTRRCSGRAIWDMAIWEDSSGEAEAAPPHFDIGRYGYTNNTMFRYGPMWGTNKQGGTFFLMYCGFSGKFLCSSDQGWQKNIFVLVFSKRADYRSRAKPQHLVTVCCGVSSDEYYTGKTYVSEVLFERKVQNSN